MTNGTFVRQDIWALEMGADEPPWDLYTLAYAKAVAVMQGRQADQPTSWSYQAAMHGTWATPPDPLWNGCQHGSWFFLPWHRIYIWYFEQIVRSVVVENGGPDDWALPYWNFTDGPPGSAALPPAFRRPQLPDGSDNPLFVGGANRSSAMNGGSPLPGIARSTKQAMDSTSFSPGFGGLPKPPVHFGRPHGLLEAQPHDQVHDVVGGGATRPGCHEGWMSDPNCAAADPIFYLHHSNIDRLWVEWLGLGGGRANPSAQEWLTESFSFFDAQGNQQSKTCGEFADIANLDYVYAGVAVPEPVAGGPNEPPKPPGDGPEIASGGGAELGTETVAVTLEPDVDETAVLDAAADPDTPRVYLHLEDVDTDGSPGIVWEVRLDPDGGGGAPEEAVGAISFFGRGHSHGDEAPETLGVTGERFIFDITDVVVRLAEEGRWDESKITVSFHPAMPEGYSEPTPTVRIGRVYVTHG